MQSATLQTHHGLLQSVESDVMTKSFKLYLLVEAKYIFIPPVHQIEKS